MPKIRSAILMGLLAILLMLGCSHSGINPVEPPGDYAYLGTWDNGLQILDISNPFDAQVVTTVEMPARINDITVHGENAYVTLDDGFDMHIVDIDPPESAHIVKTVDILPPGSGVTFSGGYVYVCGTGFRIIDVDPIETSHIVTTIEADHLNSSTVSADYAYVSSGIYYVDGGSLLVVDIDPPESASIVKTIGFGDDADGVALSGNYAYVSVNGSLQIIDISEPDAAHVASSLDIPASAGSIILSDGYAYIAGYGFHIIKLW